MLVWKRWRNEDGSPRVDSRGQRTPWPDFSGIPITLLDGRPDLGALVRSFGGWHHDEVENLSTGHPHGRAMALLPEPAAAWCAAHVDGAFVISAAEAEKFFDERVAIGRPAVERDSEMLRGLLAERELRERTGAAVPAELEEQITRALDPDDPEPGVHRAKRPHSFAELKRGLKAKIK